MLDRECKNLNLQVVMTSHSPVLIEYAFEQSQQFRKKYKTVYLSNTYGDVQVMQDWSWAQISADITTRTIATSSGASLPRINVYFEDKEAADFFAALMNRQPIKKFTNPLPEITLGCSNYLQLIKKGILEFSQRSIVCLDADQTQQVENKNFKSVILLPGNLPPDQLIFEQLYNLPASHAFWKNDLQFTREVFTNSAAEVIREFAMNGNTIDVKERVAAYKGSKPPREIFKRFYKDAEFQKLLVSGAKPYNPWKYWVESNQNVSNKFLTTFKSAMCNVMQYGYAVDVAKLATLEVKLKRV
jgi:AcrR family transcriptional regulator